MSPCRATRNSLAPRTQHATSIPILGHIVPTRIITQLRSVSRVLPFNHWSFHLYLAHISAPMAAQPPGSLFSENIWSDPRCSLCR